MNRPLLLALALTTLAAEVACGPRAESVKPPPVVLASSASATPLPEKSPYPKTRTVDVIDTIHGVRVSDPYRWLEDGKSAEVRSWLDAQDGFARAELAKLAGRDALRARLKELFYVDSLGAPQHRGTRYFYRRRKAEEEKAVIYVREGKAGKERVLLDPNAWSKDGTSSLGIWRASHDGTRVAYTVHENNSDEATPSSST